MEASIQNPSAAQEWQGDGTAPAKGGEAPARPEHIPEKFWDAAKGAVNTDALAKSYVELEKRLGQPKPTDPAQAPAQAPAVNPQVAPVEAASEYWNQHGELNDEHYAALEKAGLPKAVVDQYIAGMHAQGTAYASQVHAIAGGQESYDNLLSWAAQNLPEAESNAFDTIIESGSIEQTRMAVQGLKARYEAAVGGRESKLIDGDSGAGGPAGFQSDAEVMEAMRSPKYRSDPAYRAEVERRLARSNVLQNASWGQPPGR